MGWLQDPRPRPFYASAVVGADIDRGANNVSFYGYDIADYRKRLRDAYDFFSYFDNSDTPIPVTSTDTRPEWQFFHMPDFVIVPQGIRYLPTFPCT